jgi:hypothetical protein
VRTSGSDASGVLRLIGPEKRSVERALSVARSEIEYVLD